MLSDVKNESTQRLIEVRELLDFIQANSPHAPLQEPSNILIAKGLFFVHIYGVYEYTVKSTVSKAIDIINSKGLKIYECKPLVYSLILDSALTSLAAVGDKKWEKRYELFNNFVLNSPVVISTDLMPTNGRNLKIRQLQSIWNSFSITDPVIPRPAVGGLIQEIVFKRNQIAHGNETASRIGALNTLGELYLRHSAISETCSYIIETFEEYLIHEKYKVGN